ncbi:MAG TPA: EAL domain-containing protein [Campylobacterales bacterium]|nr:EAL domain-containing protein [Campylobacterales bacterium]
MNGSIMQENYEWLLEQYKVALDVSNIVSITDAKGIIEYVNDKFCDISGYTPQELLGKPHSIVRHPDMPLKTFKYIWETIQDGKIWKGVIKNRAKNGSAYIVDSTIIPIRDAQGIIRKYIGIRHDITALIEKEELIERQTRDHLTGLFNKVRLLEDLELCDFPVFTILNVDAFSDINDFYGLEIGDKLLCQLAIKLKERFEGDKHTLYRLHGDEFGILSQNEKLMAEHIALVQEMLIDVKKEPFDIDGQHIYVSLTAGSAYESETIVGKATMALRFAKKEHKFHQIFDPALAESYKYGENIEWSNKVRKAIAQDRVVAYFQPIMNIATGEIQKYEALVRIIDENGGVILPQQFLEVAKKSKQYPYITKKIVELAAKKAQKSGKEISVNITIEDIESSEIVSAIERILVKYGCGDKIVFEITETEEIKNYHALRGFIELIKKRFNSKVAIDDFGSGYSNFENMLELDFDYLKIDGSIIGKISAAKHSGALLDAIIAFSQKLQIETVAEFVSSEAIFDIVKEKGINYAQGFYIGKPLEDILD